MLRVQLAVSLPDPVHRRFRRHQARERLAHNGLVAAAAAHRAQARADAGAGAAQGGLVVPRDPQPLVHVEHSVAVGVEIFDVREDGGRLRGPVRRGRGGGGGGGRVGRLMHPDFGETLLGVGEGPLRRGGGKVCVV